MDTVADTHQTEDNQSLKITVKKKKLKHHFEKEAQRMRVSRMEYYEEPDLLDFIREDTAAAEGFFNWLELHSLNTEGIQKACLYFLIHSDESVEEKEKLGRDLNALITLITGLAGSRQFISEKAYYYTSVLEELDEVKRYRDSKSS